MSAQMPLPLDGEAPRSPATISSFYVRGQAMPLPEVLAGEERARTQEVVILAWMRQQGPGARLAPSDVHEAFPGYPVTSVRRAITSLTKKGQLVHHERDRRTGPWGSAESLWSVA